jgi:cytochrome c oxidase subunit II
LAQRIAPPPNIVQVQGLGRGFWQATAVLLLLCIANSAYWLFGNIDWLLPSSSKPFSDVVYNIDGLFKFMAVFGGDIMIIVAGYVIWFSIAFRASAGDSPDTVGVPIHDQPKLEFWWTVLPTILLIVLTALSIQVWHKIQFGVTSPGLTMEVIGHQFFFEYRYPGLKGTTTDAHLPVGVPVRILITSADVIHQWWVPELRLKMAAVPGLVQNLNFTPLHAGNFTVTCSEFCGINHSQMQGKVVIQSVADFNAWLDAQKKANAAASVPINLSGGNVAAGKAKFSTICSACHNNPPTPFDQKKVGPGLLHITDDPQHPTLVTGKPPTAQNIAWILQNGFTGSIGSMPNRQANGLSNQDIANLVAYLESLK